MIQVKEIASKKSSVLVEYVEDGTTVRKVVAHRDIVGGFVNDAVLKDAAPYGVPIRDLVESHLALDDFPARLEKACRDRGLWTQADFKKADLVMAALQEALRMDTSVIVGLVLSSDD
jgi:hypothetical protein